MDYQYIGRITIPVIRVIRTLVRIHMDISISVVFLLQHNNISHK